MVAATCGGHGWSQQHPVITSLLGNPGKAGHSCVHSRLNLELGKTGKRGLFRAMNVGHAEDGQPAFPRFETAEQSIDH